MDDHDRFAAVATLALIALARDDVRAVIHGGSGEGATEDGDGRPGGAASASARRFVDASFVGDPNALCVLTELLCTHGDEDGETHELSEEASDVRAACALALERRPVTPAAEATHVEIWARCARSVVVAAGGCDDARPRVGCVLLTLVPVRPRRRGARRSLRTFAGIFLPPGSLGFNSLKLQCFQVQDIGVGCECDLLLCATTAGWRTTPRSRRTLATTPTRPRKTRRWNTSR